LLKLSADSENEYLIADVIKFIGIIGFYPLEIGKVPDAIISEDEEYARQSRSHTLTQSWMGLLKEAFDLTHNLMRSTAAHESISGLRALGLAAYAKKWPMVLPYAFLPSIEHIHTQCMLKADTYRFNLAGACLRAILIVWLVSTAKPSNVRGASGFHPAACKLIQKLATIQMARQRQISLDFNHIGTVLTTKLDASQTVLQDIFYAAINRPHIKDWERHATIEELDELIKVIVTLGNTAVTTKDNSPDDYAEALYDCSYLVLKGLPAALAETSCSEKVGMGGPLRKSNQMQCDVMVLKATEKLFKTFYSENDYISLDWQQTFLGTIGHAVYAYSQRGGEHLKNAGLSMVRGYFTHLKKIKADPDQRITEDDFDYLQLAGAWVAWHLKESALSQEIADFIAKSRPFYNGYFGGSSTHFGRLGYPEIMHNDYRLPVPKSLLEVLTDQDRLAYIRANEALLGEQTLNMFYKMIRKTREPLENTYYESVRARRAQETEQAGHTQKSQIIEEDNPVWQSGPFDDKDLSISSPGSIDDNENVNESSKTEETPNATNLSLDKETEG
jgi:hypothetical protein